MMNTIEYRVDCALLKFLHHENALGCRFPIGKTTQVGLLLAESPWESGAFTYKWHIEVDRAYVASFSDHTDALALHVSPNVIIS